MSVYIFDEDIMERLVLISDASNEFPENTASSFRVRLPRVLQRDGEWEVALISISLPDEGLNLNQLTADDAHIMVQHKYRVDYTNNQNTHILKTDDIVKSDIVGKAIDIIDGKTFMQNFIDQVDIDVAEHTTW